MVLHIINQQTSYKLKVIGTTKISYEIEELLVNAQKFIIIVSPYLKLTSRLKVRLSDAFKKTEKVILIYRENEVSKSEIEWLRSFSNLSLFSIKNLHSKIYLNQDNAIITSMNLYEYSQINNHEIGVLFNYKIDSGEYQDTLNEIRIMIESEYNENPISEYMKTGDEMYTMGILYEFLKKNYTFDYYSKRSTSLYEYLCNNARRMVEFKSFELYQDESAILRSADLGRERFEILKKKLIELASK